MASSRIEFAASPFGCVLRDHNQRIIRDRERNREGTQAVIRKNLEVFVRDHFQTCIVFSTPREDSEVASSNENSQPKNTRFTNNRNCRERNNNSSNQNSRSVERERNQSNNNKEKETDTTAPPNESPTTGRQSRIGDRWGTTAQARDIINTTEKQTNEAAEIMALSSSQSVSARASSFLRENSPTTSDSSVEQPPSLKASSLLQRWREIEAESRTPRENQQSCRFSLNTNPEVITSSSSTGSSSSTKNSRTSNAEDSSYVEDPSLRSEVCEDRTQTCEPIEIPGDSARSEIPEDPFPDWASDRTAASEPNSSLYQRQSSDAGETERGRVADIIKRLSTFSQPNSPVASSPMCDEFDRENSSDLSDHGEQRGPFVVGNALPRVRGRQALKDLLIQVEQERQKELGGLVERHAVSRFNQRGRLQAMLRLKMLQRGAGTQNQQRPISRASDLDQLQRRPTIFHLRERFNSTVEQKSTASSSEEDTSKSPAQLTKNACEPEHCAVSTQDGNQNDQKDAATTPLPPPPPPPPPPPHISAPTPIKVIKAANKSTSSRETISLKERVSQMPKVTLKRPCSNGIGQLNWQGALNTTRCLNSSERNGKKEKQPDVVDTCPRVISSIIESWEEGTTSRVAQLDWARPDETAESSNVSDGDVITEEEPDIENVHHEEFIDSWQEISVTEEEEEEEEEESDHHLVEPDNRTWLQGISYQQSDFEDRRQAWYRNMLESNIDNDEIRELFERRSVSTFLTSDLRTRMDQMISSFVRQIHQTTSEANEHEYYGDEETLLNTEYNEISDYSDQRVSTSLQLPMPSRVRSRSEFQENDVSDGEQYVSTSFQEPRSSHSYEEDSPQSSPFNGQRSLELELIYDLRGHMAQLSQEMSELRKSIKSCMGMQEQLQHSIKKEVSSSADHSGKSVELNRKQKRKGNCCICYEMPVDSLLYRCGHMCTCFKCAHELQWSSGRCPICRASILDVVRAYSESQ